MALRSYEDFEEAVKAARVDYDHSKAKLITKGKTVQQFRKTAFLSALSTSKFPSRAPDVANTKLSKRKKPKATTKIPENRFPSKSGDPKLQMFVKTPVELTVCLQVNSSTSVLALKKLIQDQSGVAVEKHHLYTMRGFQLSDVLTLADHGLQQDANLELRMSKGLMGGRKKSGKKRRNQPEEKSQKHDNTNTGEDQKKPPDTVPEGAAAAIASTKTPTTSTCINSPIVFRNDENWTFNKNKAQVPLAVDVTNDGVVDGSLTERLFHLLKRTVEQHGQAKCLELMASVFRDCDSEISQIQQGSLTFLLCVGSKEGLDKLWIMVTSGELAKRLTETLITDELTEEDKSRLAVKVEMSRMDYKTAREFLEKLQTDCAQKHVPHQTGQPAGMLENAQYEPQATLPEAGRQTSERRPAETLQCAADRCEEALKEVYQTTGGFIQMLPWVDKKDMEMYTNLVMETGEGYRYQSQTVEPGKLNSYEVVLELKTKKGVAVKLTIFNGLPGRGKSTLFAKIAYDWATGSVAMQGYKLVVLLKMNALKQSSDLVDAMFDQLLGNNVRIEKGDVQSYIKKNPEKVLVLLDGFDELITTDLHKSSFGSVLKILNRKKFRGCCTLVSTRPYHYDKLVSKQLIQDPFTHVKVMGFSDKEVREYVHRFYYEEHDQAESLLAKIQSTNIPSDLTESPMLLLLMCLLWREDSNLPDTMSRLYSQAIKYIFRRKEISEDDVDTCVHEIGKVGLKGLVSPEQMLSFKEQDFETKVFGLAIQAGILTSEKVLKKPDTHNSVQFIHKTFQEYCSGKYLQHLQVANTEEFHKILDQIMSQDPTQFGFLLRFCCSDSEACTRTILQLFRERFPLEWSAEDDDVRDLALECYVEGQSEKVLDEDFVCLVIPTHLAVSEPNVLTRFLECVGDQTKRHGSDCLAIVTKMTIEGKSSLQQVFLPAAVHYMSEMTNLESLRFYYAHFGLELTDKTSTAESVCVPPLPGNMPRSGVQFSGKQIWSELLKKLKNLHRLELIRSKLTGLDLKYIAEALCSLPSLVELFIFKVILSGSGASWSIFLKEWNSLQKLSLQDCSLTGQDMKRITESLVNLPDLVELDVSGNKLQGSLELWSENLKQLTNLKKLRLAHCSWSEQDVIHCTEACSGLPNLEELDLSFNSLHGSVALWSPHLQSLQQLQEIDLRYCSLTGDDVKLIAEAMRSLTNLKALYLGGNEGLKSSAALWSAELGSLKQLHHLNLRRCGLTEPDVEHIAKSLGDLPKLCEVNLSSNEFLGGSSSSWSIHLKHVKHLNLAGCFMKVANLETFAQTLGHLTMLVELNLSFNDELGGSGEVWCEHFKHFKNLQKLNLFKCSLTGEDIKHIVQSLCTFPSLVELDLSWNELTGSGALWGEQLQLLKSLQKLKLSGCKLQGNDMNHILEPLSRLPNLAEVDFSGNQSLEGSAAWWSNHLQQFSELQKLNFDACRLTRDKNVIRDSLMIRQGKGPVVTCRW